MNWSADGQVVQTRGLTKIYRGNVRALDRVDLVVRPGELVGFLGPNGAGKTTAVQLLIGALRPTAGDGVVLGRPLGDRSARASLGYLPEQFQFPGFLTPPALLDFHGRLLGLSATERRSRARELIAMVGLEPAAGRPLKTFSKGMLQRIGIAQALLGRPRLLLLDEPTSGLDPIGTRNVRDLLVWLRSQGVAVLLNSHLLSEVELVCDRVAIIDRGRVIAQGTIDELVRPMTSVVVRASGLTADGMAAVRAIAPDVTRTEDGSLTAPLRSPEDVPLIARAVVDSGARLEALVPAHESLEEAFFRLLGYDPRQEQGHVRAWGGTSMAGPDGKPVGPAWGMPAGDGG